MPNSVAPIIVYATMSVGGAILAEAALSFLGMESSHPRPLGTHALRSAFLHADRALADDLSGIAILTTVLAFVLLGDGLRDALDVKLKE